MDEQGEHDLMPLRVQGADVHGTVSLHSHQTYTERQGHSWPAGDVYHRV